MFVFAKIAARRGTRAPGGDRNLIIMLRAWDYTGPGAATPATSLLHLKADFRDRRGGRKNLCYRGDFVGVLFFWEASVEQELYSI